jgi:cold shock protein
MITICIGNVIKEENMQEERFVGKVVWFDPALGFGFISRPDEIDLFVHWSNIISEGFKTLKKDQDVVFSIGLNNRKQPKAVDVSIIEEVKSEK